jgi:hypothetical protein
MLSALSHKVTISDRHVASQPYRAACSGWPSSPTRVTDVPSYAAAATRHIEDALQLQTAGRLDNADHLAGSAAECALKAVLCRVGGVPIPVQGAPRAGGIQFGHLPPLWSLAATHLQGRGLSGAARTLALLSGPNPFQRWDIGDRYEVGVVDQARANDHLQAAQAAVAISQTAEITGIAP